MLKAVAPGDVVTVTRIDQLACLTFDLFSILKQIVDADGKSGYWRSHGSQFDQHRARLGPLEWLIASPAFHHWHHTTLAPPDRNYASMLSWMDRIFGTYFLPRNHGQQPTVSRQRCPLRYTSNRFTHYISLHQPPTINASQPAPAAPSRRPSANDR